MSEENVLPEWAKEGLPETFHNVPFLKDTTTPEEFITRLTSAADHMGNSMRIPGPDATPENWKEFDEKLGGKVPGMYRLDLESEEGRAAIFGKLGAPEDAAGYGAEGDGEWLAEVAHKANLTKAQFENLIKGVGERNVVTKQTLTAEQAQALETLDTEWGLSGPKKYEQIEGLLTLTQAPEAFITQVKDKTASPEILKWLDAVADKFKSTANFVKDRNDPSSITPDEAQAQINELVANPDYRSNTAYGHSLQKKMLELQKAAHPGTNTTMDSLRSTGLGDILDQFGG